jgi:hypothetical protein
MLIKETIDIGNEEEVLYWSRHFSCEPQYLIRSVLSVGNTVSKVETYLALNRWKESMVKAEQKEEEHE